MKRDGRHRLAIECDGELYHLDEHGQLKAEDLERQAILERAGWEVLRISYRRWREQPEDQLDRIDDWFDYAVQDQDGGDVEALETSGAPIPNKRGNPVTVTPYGNAILEALREGVHDEIEVFRRSLPALGYQKLGNRIRSDLQEAGNRLQRAGLIAVEEGEYFLTELGREAEIYVQPVRTSRHRYRYFRTHYSSQRRRSGRRTIK